MAQANITSHVGLRNHISGYTDVVQMLTGVLLCCFVFMHMLLVSSVILSPNIMNGIALGTRLGFAVCVLLMMPVLLPVACAESLRQRLAGAWTMAASRGRVLSRPMPMADIIVLMTLLLSLSATGCWIAGGDVVVRRFGRPPTVARQLPLRCDGDERRPLMGPPAMDATLAPLHAPRFPNLI